MSDNDFGDRAIEPIAVVGMACRFPGAADTTSFWRNLVEGVESVKFFSREEQSSFGVPDADLDDPAFVPAALVLEDYDRLDAGLFGLTRREAEITDPQHRLFLELTHSALEDAGYDPARYDGAIGVYAGTGDDSYYWQHLRPNRRLLSGSGVLSMSLGNHPDYVATTVSYKLNLRGPSLTLHTACSTSMVAVHLACEALRAGECDAALAGGVCIELPQGRGYVYQEGGINSPDGHCYPFDARAAGTMWGSGGGAVLLKRLDDALADGDHVRAVILADAINNDGSTKVGFSAPSTDGQAELIAQVIGLADVDPRSISYVEAHGTGTSLGDPIEVGALSRVYGHGTDRRGWCGIGSVKSNIGHLSQAAGVAGLIKTVLALEHGIIPPSINFETPNPGINFADSPFYVNSSLTTWDTGDAPRRAAVSSFGIGGTNAHVLLEQAPAAQAAARPRPAHLVQLSARTATALTAATARLAEHLAGAGDDLDPADVAFALRAGRTPRQHRAFVVASDVDDAAAALRKPKRLVTGEAAAGGRLAFLFSGQGTQYPGMAAQLHEFEPAFAAALDECLAALPDETGRELRGLLLGGGAEAEERLRRTEFTQSALFAVEYALAALWRSWGIEPDALLGHSIGEYVAATLAGVFEPAAAMRLVALRGALIQELPAGSMLAVQSDEATLTPLLPDGVALAAVNGPRACVVSGPTELIDGCADALAAKGIGTKRLRTSHAFHSPMMDPVLVRFAEAVAEVGPRPPRRPVLSNVTGDWLTEADATDPAYWARHVREPVRFGACVAQLLGEDRWSLLECGPGRQLAGLARMQVRSGGPAPLHSLPGGSEKAGALATLYAAAGELWVRGRELAPDACGGPARRVPLPGYPYERTKFWVDRPAAGAPEPAAAEAAPRALPVQQWASVPVWRQLPPAAAAEPPARVLLFGADGLADALRANGSEVIEVLAGDAGYAPAAGHHLVEPASRAAFDGLVAALAGEGGVPDRIVFGWPLAPRPDGAEAAALRALDLGFHSLLALTQALTAALPDVPIRVDVLTAGTQAALGDELTAPEYATVSGFARVVPREAPALTVRHLDLDPRGPVDPAEVVAELGGAEELVAVRNGRRWTLDYGQADLPEAQDVPGLREGGVYLITGGLGGIGVTIAEDLARTARARLVLLGRTGLPPRERWDDRSALTDRQARAVAAIRRMERAGAQVLVLAADVADPAAMRAVRAEALARFGAVHGIVHAAGIAGGGMAEVKDRATADAVLAPKVFGTLALHAAFAGDGLDWIALCSSVTSVVGGFGQVDYCAANAFLDAYAHSAAARDDRVVSLNWGGWLEVGMAAETSAPAAFLALGKGTEVGTEDAGTAVDHPIVTLVRAASADAPAVAEGWVSAQTHWVLDEHRIGGVPVLPGTGHLETARAAFAAHAAAPGPDHVVELRDVAFLEPLAVPDGSRQRVRVVFEPGPDGAAFELVAGAEGVERAHVRGGAAWVPAAPPSVDVAAIRDRCKPWESATAGRSGMVAFGPRWPGVSEVLVGDGEELARLDAPAAARADLADWVLHPALLDDATAFGTSRGHGNYLPLGYGRVTVHRPLPATFYSHLRYRDGSTDEVITADLTLVDEAGAVLVDIGDFMLRRVDRAAVTAGLAEPAEAGALPVAATGSDGELGIRPGDGADAFRRVLAARRLGRQVVLSAVPFDRVLAGARRLTTDTVEQELVEPATEASGGAGADFVAPARGTQERLAAVWSEVLGVDRVGADDDFFDLGGNSLVAVQLIAQIRKALDIRLPMRAIFEAPTVAGMAAWIDRLRAEASAGPSTTDGHGGGIPRLPRDRE